MSKTWDKCKLQLCFYAVMKRRALCLQREGKRHKSKLSCCLARGIYLRPTTHTNGRVLETRVVPLIKKQNLSNTFLPERGVSSAVCWKAVGRSCTSRDSRLSPTWVAGLSIETEQKENVAVRKCGLASTEKLDLRETLRRQQKLGST